MPNIHVSSYLPTNIDLEPSQVPDQLDNAALDLRKVADQFNKMAQILREKKISVSATDGEARCGSFTVDEIDAGRLKQSGVLTDGNDLTKAFFIDSALDAALDKIKSKGDNLSREMLHHDKHLKDLEDGDEEEYICDDCLDNLENDEEVEDFCEHNHEDSCEVHDETIDYESVIRIEEDENGHQEIILNIQDQGNFLPSEVSLNKETDTFNYKCSSCEEVHQEKLSEVLGSLQAVIALVSNFYRSAEKNQAEAAAAAIATLEEDMRLIEALLHQEYPKAAAELDETNEDNDDDVDDD